MLNASFFAMGGYAIYVWSAFGITAIVLLGLLFSTLYQYKKIIKSGKMPLNKTLEISENNASYP